MTIESFHIDDAVDRPDEGAVEVTVTFPGGEKRWCFFMTPDRLARVGDFVQGTDVRIHPGVAHMIVVSELTEDIIARVVAQLDAEGMLYEHTISLA